MQRVAYTKQSASLDAQVAVIRQQHADLAALGPHLVAQVLLWGKCGRCGCLQMCRFQIAVLPWSGDRTS